METFTEKLNFSQKEENSTAMKLHSRNRDVGYYYDNLCLYCADNDIKITNVSDDDFMAAVEAMSSNGTSDISTDHFYFWIDA